MKKTNLMTAGAAVLSMGLLAGCGAPKPEAMVDKMFETKAESFAADIEMDVDVKADLGTGDEYTVGVGGSVSMQFDGSDKDETRTYLTTDLKMTLNDQKEPVKYEVYTITDDEEARAYAKVEDSWVLEKSDLEENPLDEKTWGKVLDEIKEVLKTGEVEKKTVKVGDEECWVLKLDTKMDAFMGVFDVILDAAGEEAEDALKSANMDDETIEAYLSYFDADLTIYASKKTGQCVKVELDMTETDTEGLLEQLDDDFGMLFSFVGVDLGSAKLDINALSFTVEYSDWNNVEVELPKKVEEEAVDLSAGYDWETGDDGFTTDPEAGVVPDTEVTEATEGIAVNPDGSVTLSDWMENPVADIYPVDGYELNQEYSSASYLVFTKEGGDIFDGSYTVNATSWLGWNEVVAEGDQFEDEDGITYVLQDEDNGIRMVQDLGIEHDGYPVYACMDGTLAESGESLDYAWYSIAFQYTDDDDWVEVDIDAEDAEDWEAEDYLDLYNEIFR